MLLLSIQPQDGNRFCMPTQSCCHHHRAGRAEPMTRRVYLWSILGLGLMPAHLHMVDEGICHAAEHPPARQTSIRPSSAALLT